MDGTEIHLAAVKRAPLLLALSERPMTMGDLDEVLSTSRSTIHRALGTFEELNVVTKCDQRYDLTGFGETVAERTREFSARLSTAAELDEFLNAADPVDVPLEHFTDAEVIRPHPHEAHAGVKRIIDLIEASDSLRMFSNVLSPLYVDVACREMVDGMEIEVVFDERLVELMVADYDEEAVRAFRTGRFQVHVGSDVPFELFIYDDKMAMAAHDSAALPRMFVETADAAAIEWAEGLYRSYRERAVEFDPADLGPVVRPGTPRPVDD